MRSPLAFLGSLIFSSIFVLSARADILHDNGGFITNPTGGTGSILGLPISQADSFTVPGQTFLFSTTGVAATVATTTAAADDFTVPDGVTWTPQSITLYAFQTSQTTATITSVRVNLWTAPPFSEGSPDPRPSPLPLPLLATPIVVPVTGTFVAHRESTSSTSTVRPVFAYTVPLDGLMSAIGHPLQPGTYWIQWAFEGALSPSSNVFMPLVTPRTLVTGHNARLYNSLTGTGTARDWFEGREGFVAGQADGRAYELPFILAGTSAPIAPPCPADFNGAGGLTVQDIFDFLAAWFAGNPSADFNHQNGLGVQDIFDFLAAWFAGC